MKWLKYRTNWSYRTGDWEYKPIFDQHYIHDKSVFEELYIEPIANENNWSEHYRGLDYEIIDHTDVPPKELDDAIKSYQRHLERLSDQLNDLLLSRPT